MESAMQAVSEEVHGQDAELSGPVVVAIGEALALTGLPAILAELTARYPAIEFDLRVGQNITEIESREVDLAVRFSSAPPSSLLGRRLGHAAIVPCAAPSYVQQYRRGLGGSS